MLTEEFGPNFRFVDSSETTYGLPARTLLRATGRRTEVVTDGQVVETHDGDPLAFIAAYQQRFKVDVMRAYRHRCAICTLRERALVRRKPVRVDVEVGVELAVEHPQDVEVELRRDALGVVVGGLDPRRIAGQVGPDQQQVLGP